MVSRSKIYEDYDRIGFSVLRLVQSNIDETRTKWKFLPGRRLGGRILDEERGEDEAAGQPSAGESSHEPGERGGNTNQNERLLWAVAGHIKFGQFAKNPTFYNI